MPMLGAFLLPLRHLSLALASWCAQDGAVTAPRAGRGLPGWRMAAHQLASAYEKSTSDLSYKQPESTKD